MNTVTQIYRKEWMMKKRRVPASVFRLKCCIRPQFRPPSLTIYDRRVLWPVGVMNVENRGVMQFNDGCLPLGENITEVWSVAVIVLLGVVVVVLPRCFHHPLTYLIASGISSPVEPTPLLLGLPWTPTFFWSLSVISFSKSSCRNSRSSVLSSSPSTTLLILSISSANFLCFWVRTSRSSDSLADSPDFPIIKSISSDKHRQWWDNFCWVSWIYFWFSWRRCRAWISDVRSLSNCDKRARTTGVSALSWCCR